MELDLTSLENAVARLAEGLDELKRHPDSALMRDGVIQRFEFTYELSHKMLRRYLEITSASRRAVEEMGFPDLIRTGSEQGLLLHGWDVWTHYRKARAETSNTYDEKKALKVAAVAPAFLEDARFLLARLRERAPRA